YVSGSVFSTAAPVNGVTFDGTDGPNSIQATVYGVYGPTTMKTAADVNGNTGGPGIFSGGLDLFAVTESGSNPNTTGIAPYSSGSMPTSPIPTDFSAQAGITETNFLVIKLTNVPTGSTLDILMQASYSVPAQQFNVYKLE